MGYVERLTIRLRNEFGNHGRDLEGLTEGSGFINLGSGGSFDGGPAESTVESTCSAKFQMPYVLDTLPVGYIDRYESLFF